MLTSVVIISSVGFLLCIYGLYVERKLKLNQSYQAVCDLSDKVSCTKTFLSPWGKMLGVSNICVGLLFYAGMILLGLLNQGGLAFVGAISACVASIFLAYILYTKVKTFCLLCMSIYIVNILLLLVSYHSI